MAEPVSTTEPKTRDHAPPPIRTVPSIRTRTSDGLTRETTNSEYGDLEDLEESPVTEQDGDGERSRHSRSTSRASTTARSMTLSRTATRRETVLSRIRSRPPIGGFSHPLVHEKTTVEDLVDFDGPDDLYRPLNWAMKKKVITTALYGFTTMSATWASSAFSPGTPQVAEQFHVGTQVATLGTSLFLFGFGVRCPPGIAHVDTDPLHRSGPCYGRRCPRSLVERTPCCLPCLSPPVSHSAPGRPRTSRPS